MRWVDLAGYSASILVFMTFYMKDMIQLRMLALCSNVAFLLYACPLHLFPIVALHGALIPVNVCRLVGACRAKRVEERPRAAPVAWQPYSRALVCVIGALVITIGTLMVITTAPASRSEISFSGPVG